MSYSTGMELSRCNRSGKKYTTKEALDKIYIVKAIKRKYHKVSGFLSIPQCLVGKRVKLIVVKK